MLKSSPSRKVTSPRQTKSSPKQTITTKRSKMTTKQTKTKAIPTITNKVIQSRLQRQDLYQTGAFINGEYVTSNDNATLDVIDPGNQVKIGTITSSNGTDTHDAIEYAYNAQKKWAQVPVAERCAKIQKWGELIMTHQKDLALLLSMEVGKPFAEANVEISYAASFMDFYAKHGVELMQPEIIQTPSISLTTGISVEKVPTGVAAALLPWNLPVAMATRKAAPALVAGCAMIIKPSELTPFSTLALGILANEAGIPPGIFQIVTGDANSIGIEMTHNHKVRKITFTGSTRTGSLLMKQSADQVKNISMELGGNAPFIIFDDANLDHVVTQAVAAKTRNCGQTCVTPNRFIVQEGIAEQFANKVAEKFNTIKVGYGLDDGVTVGPLINQAGIDKVESQVNDAVRKGAKIITGGKRLTIRSSNGESSLFYAPTVLTNCTTQMDCFQNETFGPILPIFTFKTDDEAITLANDTIAGLAAYVFTESPERQQNIAKQLEFGMVGVNQGSVSSAVAPFGGMKTSGIGREGSKFGLDAYYELKAVHHYTPKL